MSWSSHTPNLPPRGTVKTYHYAALAAGVLFLGSLVVLGGLLSGKKDGDPAATQDLVQGSRQDTIGGSLSAGPSSEDSRRVATPGGPRTGAPGNPRKRSEGNVTAPGGDAGTAKDKVAAKPTEEKKPIPNGDSVLVVVTADKTEAPIAEVLVTLRSAGSEGEAVSDESGEAVFAGIAAGVYELGLSTPDGLELTSARQVLLRAGETKTLTVHLGGAGLSISGRVLDEAGTPVPGVVVVAKRYLFQRSESDVVPRDQSQQRSVSGADGGFEIPGLLEGEYEIKTVPTPIYPSAKKIVRAGVESCDLVLQPAQALRVFGRVTTPSGESLPGVLVFPVGQPSGQTRTGNDGAYALDLLVTDPDRTYSLRFTLPGYRNLHLSLKGEEVAQADEWQLDAELEPVGLTVPVAGVMRRSDNGEPVVGETAYLHSPSRNARYLAASDERGWFLFPEVQIGDDYRFWVYPKGDFKDHSKYPVQVPEDGLELEVELDPLGTGAIFGTITDSEGRPQGGFSFWVRSTKALGRWLQLTADDEGRFEVEGIPAGDLLFDTRSPPWIRAQGVRMEDGAEEELSLVIDWGEHQLTGIVTDSQRQLLVGAQIELHWNHSEKGIRSSSMRKTLSDKDGHFRFTQLGPGPHRLSVTLPGFKSYQVNHDVGQNNEELTVKLKAE